MGKYTWPTFLIVVGAAILAYSQMTSMEAEDSKGLNLLGGIIVAIGGLMVIWRSQSK